MEVGGCEVCEAQERPVPHPKKFRIVSSSPVSNPHSPVHCTQVQAVLDAQGPSEATPEATSKHDAAVKEATVSGDREPQVLFWLWWVAVVGDCCWAHAMALAAGLV